MIQSSVRTGQTVAAKLINDGLGTGGGGEQLQSKVKLANVAPMISTEKDLKKLLQQSIWWPSSKFNQKTILIVEINSKESNFFRRETKIGEKSIKTNNQFKSA